MFVIVKFNLFKVGRIIGKGGQNVRELQRVTGSIIKLPEHTTSTAASPPSVDEETTVHIIGPFFSVQSAQRRIRTMITITNPPPVSSGRPKAATSSGQQTPQQQPAAAAPSTPQQSSKPQQNQSNAA